MPKSVKFKECRPYLGRDRNVEYVLSFRIAKGALKYDDVLQNWVVFVFMNMNDYWVGRIINAPTERDWKGKKGKNILAKVTYRPSLMSFGATAELPENLNAFSVFFPYTGDDPEVVTVSTGPTITDLTQVVDDSDVVTDLP